MKIKFLIVIILVVALMFTACGQVGLMGKDTASNEYEEKIAALEEEVETLKAGQATPVAPDLPAQTSTPQATPVPSPVPTPTPAPISNPQMYSSYAHLVVLDPVTGYAKFDYFDQLVGPEAIDALVRYEGYDDVDAMVEVQNWPEGGFYEKNENSKLRTIDLTQVDLRVIIQQDGTIIGDIGNPPQIGYADFLAIYNANHAYIKDYFFYWITVDSSGTVTKVGQVYRP